MVKVLTVGTFDTPHSGHIELFKKCRRLADLDKFDEIYTRRYENGIATIDRENNQVIVGINTDQFVFRYKGSFPAYSFEERMKIIASFKDVDKVVENNGNEDLRPLVGRIHPDFLVVGSDWAIKNYYQQTRLTDQWLKEMNVMLIYVPYTEGISSTTLRERIKNSE